MKKIILLLALMSAPFAQASKYSCNVDGKTSEGSYGKSFIDIVPNDPAKIILLDRVKLYAHIEIKDDSDSSYKGYQDATFFLTTTQENTSDYSAGIVTGKIKKNQKFFMINTRIGDGLMSLSCTRVPDNFGDLQ